VIVSWGKEGRSIKCATDEEISMLNEIRNKRGRDFSLAQLLYHSYQGSLYYPEIPEFAEMGKRAFVPDDEIDEYWVQVSPNPASEFFSLQNRMDMDLEVEILNLQGVSKLKSTISGLEVKELELDNWQSGYYLAIFRNPNGEIRTSKLLVLK